MEKNILEVFESCLMDHLGEVYNQNMEYRQNIAKEAKLAEGLEKNFTEEQMDLLKEYFGAVCSTSSICEFLAYRQGMRDLAAILGVEMGVCPFAAGEFPMQKKADPGLNSVTVDSDL